MKKLIAVILLLVLVLLSLHIGSSDFSLLSLLEDNNKGAEDIIWGLRLPRTLMALLVGASSALAGLVMQTVFKNPLAGPSTLGVTSGASLGIVVFLFVPALNTLGFLGSVVSSFAGAFTFLLIIVFAFKRFQNVAVVLIMGLLLGYFSYALIEFMINFSSNEAIKSYVFWGMGSLEVKNWWFISVLFATLSITCLFLYSRADRLNIYLLGDTESKLSGHVPQKIRSQMIFVSCLLVALVTSIAGPIAFIGIVVPNLFKLVFKTANHKKLIPLMLVGGASLCLFADLLSRGVIYSTVLPINAVLSVFGAPFVVYLLLSRKANA